MTMGFTIEVDGWANGDAIPEQFAFGKPLVEENTEIRQVVLDVFQDVIQCRIEEDFITFPSRQHVAESALTRAIGSHDGMYFTGTDFEV